MPISWDPTDHIDPAIKKFIFELNQLISKYALYVEKDIKTTTLIIRNKKNWIKLMEYQPDKNKLINWYKNPNSCKEIGIPGVLCNEFNAAFTNYGSAIRDSNISIFTDFIRRILATLFPDADSEIKPPLDIEVISSRTEEGNHLPTKDDFNNARRRILREGKKQISIDEILDIMELNLTEAGISLTEEWRSVTRNNILQWTQEN